ncbi:MAG: hypothetical protein HN423_08300, partial [Alphaproteobacteria bacterium]|nr:hypothetical protein [Alphaproteobacteria bacterium]
MSTYTQILYHIVFATKNREPVLSKDRRADLYKYIWGIVQKRDGHVYRIGSRRATFFQPLETGKAATVHSP